MMIENDYSDHTKETDAENRTVKCSNCNGELTSSDKWVGDRDNILCVECYQHLAFPDLDDCYMRKLH